MAFFCFYSYLLVKMKIRNFEVTELILGPEDLTESGKVILEGTGKVEPSFLKRDVWEEFLKADICWYRHPAKVEDGILQAGKIVNVKHKWR